MVRIENSKAIPRIGINIQYSTLSDFVLSNLSDEIKNKYSYLLRILNSNNYEDALSGCTQDDANQMLSLMLNNVIQYNVEKHFNFSGEMADTLDLSMFKVYDDLDNGREIIGMSNLEILNTIKNALGHNHVDWDDKEMVLINEWNPETRRKQPKKIRIVCSIKDLISFLLQINLYTLSTSNRIVNSKMNKL